MPNLGLQCLVSIGSDILLGYDVMEYHITKRVITHESRNLGSDFLS